MARRLLIALRFFLLSECLLHESPVGSQLILGHFSAFHFKLDFLHEFFHISVLGGNLIPVVYMPIVFPLVLCLADGARHFLF